jgi:hypothetical protein
MHCQIMRLCSPTGLHQPSDLFQPTGRRSASHHLYGPCPALLFRWDFIALRSAPQARRCRLGFGAGTTVRWNWLLRSDVGRSIIVAVPRRADKHHRRAAPVQGTRKWFGVEAFGQMSNRRWRCESRCCWSRQRNPRRSAYRCSEPALNGHSTTAGEPAASCERLGCWRCNQHR